MGAVQAARGGIGLVLCLESRGHRCLTWEGEGPPVPGQGQGRRLCWCLCPSQKAEGVRVPGGQRQEGAGSQACRDGPGAIRMGQGQRWLSVWVPQSGPEGEVWEFQHRHWPRPTCRASLLRVLEGAGGARAGPCRTAGDLKSSSEWQQNARREGCSRSQWVSHNPSRLWQGG